MPSVFLVFLNAINSQYSVRILLDLTSISDTNWKFDLSWNNFFTWLFGYDILLVFLLNWLFFLNPSYYLLVVFQTCKYWCVPGLSLWLFLYLCSLSVKSFIPNFPSLALDISLISAYWIFSSVGCWINILD